MLKDKNLFDIITKEQLDKTIEGEFGARRAIFLSCCSVWTRSQIHTLVNSESSAGKSYICGEITDLFPVQMVEYRTRISPTAFTYWHNAKFEPEWTWDSKICYLEDVSDNIVNSDVFKVMCSEGSIATIVIKQRAYDIRITGKPTMLLTTASAVPKSEVMNRFNLITLDETESQTRAVKYRQARAAAKERRGASVYDSEVASLGLLKQVEVIIPYAEKLVPYFGEVVRARRDFGRFLDLIKSSAALHQFQRNRDGGGNIIASEQDYALAREASQYMTHTLPVGMTHRLAKAYEKCKEVQRMKVLDAMDSKDIEEADGKPIAFSAKDLMENGSPPHASKPTWLKWLEVLHGMGLLEIKVDVVGPDGGRPKDLYSVYEDESKKELPLFDIL